MKGEKFLRVLMIVLACTHLLFTAGYIIEWFAVDGADRRMCGADMKGSLALAIVCGVLYVLLTEWSEEAAQ